jgi:hypothetical protein
MLAQNQRLISSRVADKLPHGQKILPLAELPTIQPSFRELAMPIPMTAQQVLDREFLEIRCKILEVAAALDRLERAEGTVDADPRVARLQEALSVLCDENSDRAEQIQMIFSRPYEPAWREKFGLTTLRKAK